MKNSAFVILLTFFSLQITAQNKDLRINQLRIAFDGDSTLFIERYEIDLLKKKVFYITPIANYLHIEGAKLRTHVNISNKQWSDIKTLINELNFIYLDSVSNNKMLNPAYIIETYKSTNEYFEYRIHKNDIPIQIEELFEIIRNAFMTELLLTSFLTSTEYLFA